MALFGKSDDSVPILTAFYQISIPVDYEPLGSELDVLFYRYFQRDPHSLYLWSDTRSEPRAEVETALRLVSGNHSLIKRAMNAAAAQKMLTDAYDPGDFNALIREMLTPPQVHFLNGSAAQVWYRNDPTTQIQDRPAEDVKHFMGAVLTTFVRATEQESWFTCEECASVFAAARKPARFCSERCRARFGERRRRKERNIRSIHPNVGIMDLANQKKQ